MEILGRAIESGETVLVPKRKSKLGKIGRWFSDNKLYLGAGAATIVASAAAGAIIGRSQSYTISEIVPPFATSVPATEIGLDPILCNGDAKGESLNVYVEEGQVFDLADQSLYVEQGKLNTVPIARDTSLTDMIIVGNYAYIMVDRKVPESKRNYEVAVGPTLYTQPVRTYEINLRARCIGISGQVPMLPSVYEKVSDVRKIDLTRNKIATTIPDIPLFRDLR